MPLERWMVWYAMPKPMLKRPKSEELCLPSYGIVDDL